MSGSSLDGIDLACCEFTITSDKIIWQLLKGVTYPIPDTWKTRLIHLPAQSAVTFVKTHAYFGHFLAEILEQFIATLEKQPDFIASHGHTIFHEPDKRYTTQIGCGAAIAAKTGLPVINDFRIQDIAIDGEGTPLAPAADKFLFPDYDFYLNIGGIANITAIHEEKCVAFDIAPANQVLNYLAQQLNLPYDKDGLIAKGGKLIPDLLKKLDTPEFYRQDYPKSLGNLWIVNEVLPMFDEFEDSIQDKLATATHFLASKIIDSIKAIIQKENLPSAKKRKALITGGGAFNSWLMELMNSIANKEALNIEFVLPAPSIIEYKEAILMGLLGILRLQNTPNCFASVTGAKRDTIGGIIHQGYHKFI